MTTQTGIRAPDLNRIMNGLKAAYDRMDEQRRVTLNEAIDRLDEELGDQPPEVAEAVERFIQTMWTVL